MFGIGMGELLVIFVVALIAIGPEKLPKVARTLAQILGQVRRASDDLKHSILLANPLDDSSPTLVAKQKNPPLSPFQKGEIQQEVVARGEDASHG